METWKILTPVFGKFELPFLTAAALFHSTRFKEVSCTAIVNKRQLVLFAEFFLWVLDVCIAGESPDIGCLAVHITMVVLPSASEPQLSSNASCMNLILASLVMSQCVDCVHVESHQALPKLLVLFSKLYGIFRYTRAIFSNLPYAVLGATISVDGKAGWAGWVAGHAFVVALFSTTASYMSIWEFPTFRGLAR